MRILKYKKLKNGKYEVSFDNNKSLELYEDVILKFELLINKEVDAKTVLSLTDYNLECDVYYVALKYIKTRYRSCSEVEDYLLKKEFPKTLVTKAIEKLFKQKYIDDLLFAKSYTHTQIITTSWSPKRIEKELAKKNIASENISIALNEYDEQIEQDKIIKRINRMIKSNTNKGNNFLKLKIKSDLITEGFSQKLVEESLKQTKFSNDRYIYIKEYAKLYNKLSKKYSGKELEYNLRNKLYQKGFSYEED